MMEQYTPPAKKSEHKIALYNYMHYITICVYVRPDRDLLSWLVSTDKSLVEMINDEGAYELYPFVHRDHRCAKQKTQISPHRAQDIEKIDAVVLDHTLVQHAIHVNVDLGALLKIS